MTRRAAELPDGYDKKGTRMFNRRMLTKVAGLTVVALVVLACGPEEAVDEPEPDEPAEMEPEPDEPAEEPPAEEPAAEATVALGRTDLGEVLVDADGMTLYVFDPDEQGPSTCYDDCAAAWPPLIDDDPVAGDGVDAALLSTAERDDGSQQVTYDDWPLYLWQGDSEPGDATGQGVNDIWWVIEADGTVVGGDAEEAGRAVSPEY